MLNMWKRDDFEAIGDWCKQRERELLATTAIGSDEHFIIRVDGRAFHTFTRGMERPFSAPFRRAMQTAAATVLTQLKPQFTYFQSDEITYVWTTKNKEGFTHPFGGKVSKLLSVVASLTSVAFYKACIDEGIELGDKLPHFDARLVEVLPANASIQSLLQPVQWRENDAMRNAIAMVAQSMFSQSELHGKNSYVQATMASDAGYDWEAVPAGYIRGTYLVMSPEQRELTPQEIIRIPEDKRPKPGETFTRRVMKECYFATWDYVERMAALLPRCEVDE